MRDFTLADLPHSPATQAGVWTPDDPEWHELRAVPGMVSGTMAGTIAGLSKWDTAVGLWAKKTGRVSDHVRMSEPMEWGQILEPVILAKYQREHPKSEVLVNCGTWIGADEWSLANPDALVRGEDGVTRLLEVKTATYTADWNVPPQGVTGDSDDVPLHYVSQVQWYLRTLGLPSATLIALFGGSKYREFVIPADPNWQYTDYKLAAMFRHAVLHEEKPDWPGASDLFKKERK